MATFPKQNQLDRLLSPLQENTYSVKQHAYPEDLGGNEFGHFIQFVIYETKTQNNPLQQQSQRPILNGDSLGIQRSLSDTSGPRRDRAGATGVQGRKDFGSANRTYRTSDLITLYMPENITTTYGLDYENINIAQGVIAGQGASVGSAVDEVNQFDSGSLSNLSQRLGSAMKSLQKDSGTSNADQQGQVGDLARVAAGNSSDIVEAALSANLREARNPHMEFLFRGVQQRTFAFTFTFTPKSEEEARRVRDIVQLFKHHAIPKVRESAAGIFYEYPAEFDILFLSNGKENDFLHKISTCALTSIDVNYQAAGITSMHREIGTSDGGSGAPPTHTEMTLEFTEMELMSQQRIDQGF